jgi:uncharacterized protein (TIGR00369 family)
VTSGGESDLAQGAGALAGGDMVAATEWSRRNVPINALMGLTIVRADADGAVLTMERNDEVKGSMPGTVHGGILATFADTACATALVSAYDPALEIPVTTDLHIRYYRQPKTGPLTATATVVHRGRQLLSAECCVVDADDRVLVRATATYMIVRTTA